MNSNLLQSSKRVHFIGIGGTGMSGLAGILQNFGKYITGSDNESSHITHKLQKNGINTIEHHSAKNIKKALDLVIYSLAIEESNQELKAARLQKIPILSYPEAVGQLTKQFYTIAICGTHGKSTITALISKILLENNFDPTVLLGTTMKELKGRNFRVGKSKILVLEACEYRRAFLNYSPRVIVLHTLDPDHLDYYRDFADYLKAFREFASKLPPEGYFFGNLDDEDIYDVLKTLQGKKFPLYNTFTYGTKYASSDFYLKEKTIIQKDKHLGELNLKIPGFHNRTNALAAFSVCATLGIAPRDILQGLNTYEGAYRRFELRGKLGKTLIIDDYGHHPTEIKATLDAARELFPKKKICVVFQPHQYSRTKKLFKEFAASFGKADCVIIPNIYEVRDTEGDKGSVSAEKLVNEIKKHHTAGFVRYGEGISNTVKFLKKNAKNFDVILTMGAGDVWKVAEGLLK